MLTNNLYSFFKPESVAIIGASQKTGAIGNVVVKNFVEVGYKGAVYPVNPRYENVEGYQCYPTISQLPNQIDVAIIAVPNDYVESSIHECAEKGIKNFLVFSSGFAELGADGLKKQEDIIAYCKVNKLRLLGPNTLGMINVHDKISLTFQTIDSTLFLRGNVGLVAQSGATGSQVLNMASEEEVGFTYMVATGNQPDLNTVEIMDFYVDDAKTEVIGFYMEGVPSGKGLLEMAEKALKQHKPVVGIKSGRSLAGQKAAMSHTASLTGSNEVFKVAAEKYGITLVEGLDQLVDTLKAFKSGKRPKGNRVATVVVSGATGIMLADALHDYDLEMADLSQATKDELRKVLPSYCSVENPVDIASTFILNEEIYPHSVQTLVDAEEVDIVIIHMPVPTSLGPLKFADMFIDISQRTDKPVIVMPTGIESEMGEIRRHLVKHGVPAYRNLETAAKAAHDLLTYERKYGAYIEEKDAEEIMSSRTVVLESSNVSITEPEVKSILSSFQISVPNGVLVKPEEAVRDCVKGLQYPVVAKIVSPQIPHKSDVGGVILNIDCEEELTQAVEEIISNVKRANPTAQIEGVLVEEMVAGSFLEAIVGVKNDEMFGPVLLCGLGGIFVEVMKDVSQRLAPVSHKEAFTMIEELKSYPIFNGARTGIQYDVNALADALVQISKLANNLQGNWTSLEINPLIVREQGKGVLALDGLITLDEKKQAVIQN